MKGAWPCLLLLGLACAGDDDDDGAVDPPAVDCDEEPFDGAVVEADIAYLASEKLDGRYPGDPGDAAARLVVEARFACLGLDSILPGEAWQEPFTDSLGRETANVLAALPGADDRVADEVILVSAHLDHFGDGLLGANDNASGLAGLMAIASALAAGPPLARTVVFAAFGSEESGFEGSETWYTTTSSTVAPADVVFNVNLDMVGTYDQTGIVYALGTMQDTPGRAVMDALVGAYPSLDVGLGDGSDQSDNVTFCSRGVPYIFVWTEDPECYHEACDTADRIDTTNLIPILNLTADATAALADSADDLQGLVQPGQDVCL